VLFFFDETFRKSSAAHGKTLGALSGIAIPERELNRVSSDIYRLKLKHFDKEFASNGEVKASSMLSNSMFRLEKNGTPSHNLAYARDLLEYIVAKHFWIFGCVCFEKEMQNFQVKDVTALDLTYRYLFERVNMFMKIKYPEKMAKIVFDDRDYGTNQKNASAITNFFQRSAAGLSFDSIVRTPFFAISQSQNVGLHLADFVTTIIGMGYANHPHAKEFYEPLKRCTFVYEQNGRKIYSIKLIPEKKEALGSRR
jgi:hypothetical protein